MKFSIFWLTLFCMMNVFSIVKAEDKTSFNTNKINHQATQEDKLNLLLNKFETYAEAQRKVWNVQSMAIAIVKDDKVLFSKGYGQRGLKDSRSVDENTLFQIGSLSKAFTSTLVALEIEKGKMKWEDKVIAHMADFRMADPWVTAEFQILDLLSQRSGLPPYANPPQTLTTYTGTYRNPIFGKVTVKEEGSQLVIVFEKKEHSFSLKPWDRDIFSMEWPIVDLEAQEPVKVLFYSNNQGKIEKMIIDQLSDEGNGVFEKEMTP